MNYFTNAVRDNLDFNVVQYGYRACTPRFGEPHQIRKTYLLHYVYAGKGHLLADGVRFDVEAGQAFLIFPDQLTTYIADERDPFIYRWVEFYGNKVDALLKAAHLSPAAPIFTDTDGALGDALEALVSGGNTPPMEVTARFWHLAQAMAGTESTAADDRAHYVEQAVNFIHFRISHKTTVSDVAAHLALNRSYLSRLFKQAMGISTKQYIFDAHMDAARTLLADGRLSIGEVAQSVGYDNPLDFTKAFRRAIGVSPSAYKKEHTI